MFDDEDAQYIVVRNEEEQYSIWPAEGRSVPDGWMVVGEANSRQHCLEYIDANWTDMRPRSARRS